MGLENTIDWELIQFKFEALDYSVEQLAAEHTISLALLKYATASWEKIELPKTDKLDIDSLASDVQSRAQFIDVLSRRYMGPKLTSLGCTLLDKTLRLANSINATDKRTANTLKILTAVYQELRSIHAPTTEETGGGSPPTKWEVHIVEPKTNGACETKAVCNKTQKV